MSLKIKLIYAVAILYGLVVLAVFPKWTVDDAYIYYRYADNLANHGALTWNVGETPIEGYTGIALPTILAGVIKLGWSVVMASHVIGVASYLITALALYFIAKKLGFSHLVRAAMLLFYFTLPFLFTNAYSGLETSLFCALLTLSMLIMVNIFSGSTNKPFLFTIVLVLLLLLTSLTRPEGVIFAGVFLLVMFYNLFKTHRSELTKFIVISLVFYILPALVYFIWRYNYYGMLLPNTYYAKLVGGFHLNHIKDLVHFLLTYFSIPLVASLIIFLPNVDWIAQKIKNKNTFLQSNTFKLLTVANFIFLAIVALQFTQAKLRMNFSYRFFVPFIIPITIFMGGIWEAGYQALQSGQTEFPIRKKVTIYCLLALTLLQLLTVAYRLKDEVKFATSSEVSMDYLHLPAGQYLKEHFKPSDWLVVLYDAGAIPYVSELKTVDMGALNDTYIATQHPETPEKIDYFFKHDPAVAVFTSYATNTVDHDPLANALAHDSRFVKNYTLQKVFMEPGTINNKFSNYYQLIYVKNKVAK